MSSPPRIAVWAAIQPRTLSSELRSPKWRDVVTSSAFRFAPSSLLPASASPHLSDRGEDIGDGLFRQRIQPAGHLDHQRLAELEALGDLFAGIILGARDA